MILLAFRHRLRAADLRWDQVDWRKHLLTGSG